MSAFGDAAASTPEINHTLMSTGDLGASLEAAVAGYESVADMLMAELTAMGLNTSTTAMVGWQGPGGVMMQMSAAEFMTVCAAVSAWVRVGQVQAGEVAAAHAQALNSMIPAEVCLTNRATQQGLIDTNFMGFNTPAIAALEAQYQGFWVTNATARTGYGAVVTTALGALAVPPPLSPTAANPAAAAAAVAQDGAQSGVQGALQTSAKSMTEVADSPVKNAMAEPSAAGDAMSSMMGQFGQVGSMLGQVTQAGGQLPQMLGQLPQMMSGMLGPLSSMQGMDGAASAAAFAPGAAGAMPSVGGLGSALAGAGGGGGGMVSGPSALSSTFVRPASSFNSPTSPTLPGGWQGGAAGEAGQARPATGLGGGGMYGAPPGMGRGNESQPSEKTTRTMQVTARPGANRGERQPI